MIFCSVQTSYVFDETALVTIFSFDLLGPSQPKNFIVQLNPDNPKILMLSWNQPQSFTGKINYYHVLYKKSFDSWKTLIINGKTHKTNISDVAPDSLYYFKIFAIDSVGSGPMTIPSNIRTITGKLSLTPVIFSRLLVILYPLLQVKPQNILKNIFIILRSMFSDQKKYQNISLKTRKINSLRKIFLSFRQKI